MILLRRRLLLLELLLVRVRDWQRLHNCFRTNAQTLLTLCRGRVIRGASVPGGAVHLVLRYVLIWKRFRGRVGQRAR